MHQVMAGTSIETIAYVKFKPNNLEAIIGMIRDHPTAAYQLLSSNAQLKSLEETFKTIKDNLDKKGIGDDCEWQAIMTKLVEVIKEMRRIR